MTRSHAEHGNENNSRFCPMLSLGSEESSPIDYYGPNPLPVAIVYAGAKIGRKCYAIRSVVLSEFALYAHRKGYNG
jgi:hypothetical protein